MPLVRRVAVALATLVGLVVAVLGLWLAVVLGPSGTATFTARATGPVVIGPDVLGGYEVPAGTSVKSTWRATIRAGGRPVNRDVSPPTTTAATTASTSEAITAPP